jgi:Uma2 family endonuclease
MPDVLTKPLSKRRTSAHSQLPHFVTFEEYCKMPEDRFIELIQGVLYQMPHPTMMHQSIVRNLTLEIGFFLRSHPGQYDVFPGCNVYAFPNDDGILRHTNLIPDVAVAEKSKEGSLAVIGAPLLVVEILSPSNKKHDTVTKFKLYQSAGVEEYWIIDPHKETVQVNILKDGAYSPKTYEKGEVIKVKALPGLEIEVTGIFRN